MGALPPREHTDEDAAAPAAARWLARVQGAAVLALCLAVTDAAPPVGCEEAVRESAAAVAVAACRLEYGRTADPRTGARLADALRRAGDPRGAADLAHELLATPATADALYVLGRIAGEHGQHELAEQHLRHAAERHEGERRFRELARDLLASGELAAHGARHADALIVLDRCLAAAAEGRDPETEGGCRLGAARVLWRIGYRSGARRELALAEAKLVSEAERAWLELEGARQLGEEGRHELAAGRLRRALALASRAGSPEVAVEGHLGLAHALAELGRVDEAAEHARRAAAASAAVAAGRGAGAGAGAAGLRLIEARIALRRGDHARAAGLAEAEHRGTPPSAHDRLRAIETLRAEIALRGGDLAGAEAWARRAIANAEVVRSQQAPLEARSWASGGGWAAHELLFASVARRGDAAGALLAFERWQGRAALDGLAAAASGVMDEGLPDAGLGGDVPAELEELRALERLVGSLAGSALATPAPDGEILDAARAGLSLVLAVADGELWRITADEGRLEVASLGPLGPLRARLEALRARPGDAELAAELGARLVPPALARPGERVLSVILDERDAAVARLPAAALRTSGRALGTLRPVVRAVRISDTRCDRPAAPPRRVAVIADAAGDLPAARREAEALAVRQGAAIALGAHATRPALFAAMAGELLHLAVHAKLDDLGGGVLELADGPVTPLDLAAPRRAPGRVVLASPIAGGRDPATHAMAIGLLAAGARQVIATVRDADDAAVARLTGALYEGGGADLVRALARLQAAPGGEAWLGVAAFGRATCGGPP